jgi:hypothetical protein
MRTRTDVEKFTTFPGKCFRYVDEDGRARHCPKRAVHTGQFIDRNGTIWTVDACDEHVKELDGD